MDKIKKGNESEIVSGKFSVLSGCFGGKVRYEASIFRL